MKTLKSEWMEFASTVTPPNASDEQTRDMNKIFYAGAHAVMTILMTSDTEPMFDDTMEKFIAIHKEINEYVGFISRTDSN